MPGNVEGPEVLHAAGIGLNPGEVTALAGGKYFPAWWKVLLPVNGDCVVLRGYAVRDPEKNDVKDFLYFRISSSEKFRDFANESTNHHISGGHYWR